MLKILKSWVIFFLVFLNASVFALNVNFSSPSLTTPGTPSLATLGENAQISTDSSGRYVYAVWNAATGALGPIEVVISADYGTTWTAPIELATSGQNAQIITDGSGQFAYAVWLTASTVEAAITSNFGVTWSASPIDLQSINRGPPQITTDITGKFVYVGWSALSGEDPELVISSDFGNTWSLPALIESTRKEKLQITTDSTGKYVYAIWRQSVGPPFPVQVSISPDFGATWTIHFTSASDSATEPQITTDNSGKYVYAIWRNTVLPNEVQVAVSSDFGVTWQNPTSTPEGTPDIGDSGGNPQITTDNTGRYVYAIWNQLFAGTAVQVAISSDFGRTWQDPTTTPTGTTPNLAAAGENTQITTDSSGRYVFAAWNVSGGAVQTAFSSDFGLSWASPIITPTGTTPNLATIGENAQIITDATGKSIYAIWDISGGAVQEANGFKTFFPLKNVTTDR